MKTQIEVMNKKFGWIPLLFKTINNEKYQLWDIYYIKNNSQMRSLEVITLPSLKTKYKSVRQITRGDTLAVYVR